MKKCIGSHTKINQELLHSSKYWSSLYELFVIWNKIFFWINWLNNVLFCFKKFYDCIEMLLYGTINNS